MFSLIIASITVTENRMIRLECKRGFGMGSDNWKNLYAKGKQNRPGITEIMAFLPRGVGILFQEFSRHLSSEYDVGCKPPVYTEKDGWVYAFGRYDVHLLNHVTMEDGGFSVQGFLVRIISKIYCK